MFASSNRRVRPVPQKGRVRVLVVDDSVLMRRLVTHALSEDPQLEVVGAAPNGSIALQRISELQPDAVTLDIEMPEMDGLEALRRIRKTHPDLPVIMLSTLTERGAAATLDVLALGASDYVAKASNGGSIDHSMAALRSELIPSLKQFFSFGKPPAALASPTPKEEKPPVRLQTATPAKGKGGERRVVAIGVSTGGPNALAEVLPAFPKDFPVPILIVQHMPPVFTRFLADRLHARSAIPVEEVTKDTRIEPGRAFVAAGGYHMRVRRSDGGVTATLNLDPPENSCRPAVDVLFRSVAEVYGGASIGVILTGMGHDGAKGCRILADSGSYIIAQDEASSVVWGMPGSVVKAGLAHATVDIAAVVPEILKQF